MENLVSTVRSNDWLLRDEDEDDEFIGHDAFYRQSPLQGASVTQIRLLHIAEAQHVDAAMELSLTVESLIERHPPRYIALSYTWHTSRDEESELLDVVTIDNRYHKRVTSNLMMALRALRHLGYLTVWIDQLSINQDDLEERGDQVRRMAQIFSQASAVVIYLGEETEIARTALQYLSEASKFVRECEKADSGSQDQIAVPSLRLRREALEGWLGIYDYSWFTRVWVVQETLFARQTSFIVGLQEYDATPLRLPYHFLSSGISHMLKTELSRNQDAFRTRSKVLSAWAWLTRAHDCYQSEALYSSSLEALDWMRAFGATDKRDRIFAMLAPLRLDAVPDYKASVPVVYTRFAASQVRQSLGNTLEIIEAAGVHNQTNSDLPSWVPDWTAPRRYRVTWARSAPERFPPVKNFVECNRKTIISQLECVIHNPVAGTLFLDRTQTTVQRPRVSYRLNAFELAMKGAMVGSVTSLSPALTQQKSDSAHVRNILQWHRDIRSLAFHTHSRHHPDPLMRVSAVIRTAALAFNLVNQHTTIIPYLHNLESLERHTRDYTTLGAARQSRMLELVPQHHRICFTHEGHIALVPEASQPGDCVAVLVGYEYSVVLRPLEQGRFKYVGGAHVIDVIDGKCRLDLQKFIVR